MLDNNDLMTIKAVNTSMNKGFNITGVYEYADAAGNAIYWRLRLDDADKNKTYLPVHLGAGDVLVAKEPHSIKKSKPLYKLDLLAQNPQAHVWLVEGEKCSNKLNDFFDTFGILGQHVATTSGSATSADKANWQPLAGRNVTIWPDDDAAGEPYAEDVAECLEDIANSVWCIDVAELNLGDGDDCVEWLEQNPDAEIADLVELPKKQMNLSDVDMVCFDDVEMKAIEWLWEGRIAYGKIIVIAGHPGLGKSQITASIAATVTTGRAWPDGTSPAQIGDVIFLSAEDDAGDTIKPRLLAVDADISRCHMLQAVKIKNEDGKASERSFDLSRDIKRLGKIISSNGNVKLVIVDPISAYMGGVDSHNNSDVRGLLAPLAAMAAKHNTAIILLTHFNKSTQQDMIARFTGSIGFIAAARAGFGVLKDPEKPEIRYFIPVKNNIGDDENGFAFQIEGVELNEEINTSKICWGDEVKAQNILYPEAEVKPTATSAAGAFLQDLLSGKPMLAKDVFDEADGGGYSKQAMQRAANRLGIKRKKISFEEGWQWQLHDYEELEDVEEIKDIIAAPSQTFSKAMAKLAEDAADKTVKSSIPSTPSAKKNKPKKSSTIIPKQKRGKK